MGLSNSTELIKIFVYRLRSSCNGAGRVCGWRMFLIFSRSERSGLTSLINGLVLARGSSNHRMVCNLTVTSMLTRGSKSILVS